MSKVLFVTHQLAFNKYGGAETQIIKTLKYINTSETNYQAKLFDMWHDNIENYDIIHIFKPTAFPLESLHLLKYAQNTNVKVAVSPIFYYPNTEKISKDQIIFQSVLKLRKTFLKRKPFSYLDPYRFSEILINNSDIILPNTHEEYNSLNDFFNLSNDNYSVIPNGVEIEFKYGNPDLFEELYNVRDFIVFIGRIERRKNVLRLIRAFVKSGLKTHLVIIGKKIDEDYFELCRRNSNNKVIFLPPIPHDSELLKSAYKAARVLALPSDYETPGLAALEGGISGTNIVITKVGGTKEYFGEYAWYVDPSNEDSIQNALIEAYNKPKDNKLSKYLEMRFTWDKVAKTTTKAYDKIL